MGVCAEVEIEDFKDKYMADTDGKGIADIILNIASEDDSLAVTLAKKYNVDLKPFKKIPKDEGEEGGPWQDPTILWRAAHGLHQAIEKEGENLIGKDLFWHNIDPENIDYYKHSLLEIIKSCKFAHDHKKRVRLTIF